MLRGCQRRIVYIKDTENRIFEEAYFILRRGVSGQGRIPSDDDMLREAGALINTAMPYIYPSARSGRGKLKYAAAFALGAVTCFAIFAITLLFF